MALFRKKQDSSSADSHSALPLDLLARRFSLLAPRLENREMEPILIRARYADQLRDIQVTPLPPNEFDQLTEKLQQNDWRRILLALTAFELESLTSILRELAHTLTARELLVQGFQKWAIRMNLHTMRLIRQSPLRAEEAARRLAHQLEIPIAGETTEESDLHRKRLDYRRLLKEAEKAKVSAEEQLEYLKELQDRELRQHRRGKW